MNEEFYTLQNVDFLMHLLWIIPLLVGVYIYAAGRRKSCLQALAGSGKIENFNDSHLGANRVWKAVIVITASIILIIAISRPAWNPQPQVRMQKGRDVVFLLDVSKSMLAQDLRPSRLERAKLAIKDCIEKIRGDRVGLVVFAGNAKVACPLTLDYGFFREALDNAGPDSVDRGGTMVADAIRKTTEDLLNQTDNSFKDIILITDGGDEEDKDKTLTKFATTAAQEAGEKNIRIIAIGIGDEKNGSRIPLTDENGNRYFMKYNGKDVVSRLNADMLRKIKDATPDGKYVPVGTGSFELDSIYKALIDSAKKRDLEEKTVRRYEEKFQLFLACAFVLLFVQYLINEKNVKADGVN